MKRSRELCLWTGVGKAGFHLFQVLGLGTVLLLSSLVSATSETVRSSPVFTKHGPTSVGGTLELTGHRGERVHTEDFSGKFLLVYFGYTFCPDVCLAELQKVTDHGSVG